MIPGRKENLEIRAFCGCDGKSSLPSAHRRVLILHAQLSVVSVAIIPLTSFPTDFYHYKNFINYYISGDTFHGECGTQLRLGVAARHSGCDLEIIVYHSRTHHGLEQSRTSAEIRGMS